MELIKTYFVSTKMFELKINKLAPYKQSTFLQNSADIHYLHSQHFSRLTEQTHVL